MVLAGYPAPDPPGATRPLSLLPSANRSEHPPAGTADAAATDPLAALLVVRVGVEHVVGDVFEDLFQPRTRHGRPAGLGIGERGDVVDSLDRDRRAGENGCAPPKARRKRDLSVALGD